LDTSCGYDRWPYDVVSLDWSASASGHCSQRASLKSRSSEQRTWPRDAVVDDATHPSGRGRYPSGNRFSAEPALH